ncbi:Uncharacterised protein [BD1-7 clade bacterium]|uniref:Protein required for attachment to host cells n=1 Tax=BD1-7 clade bacterium TaxID=2029982 RepID=A0A5S9QG16_9GAMM|nr:Uncharacterised protein [BD1-7 clade bacterium]CAA0116866.1 Uncharacterised protein [BD1-7 clade bacterium]
MKATWALVADNSEARLYKLRTKPKSLELLDTADHEQGRWHNGDFVTSQPGRTHSAMGKVANRSVGDENTAKIEESRHFAAALADDLNEAYALNAFGHLHVCAPPKLMGEILPKLSKKIDIVNTVSKDLIKSPEAQILDTLVRH